MLDEQLSQHEHQVVERPLRQKLVDERLRLLDAVPFADGNNQRRDTPAELPGHTEAAVQLGGAGRHPIDQLLIPVAGHDEVQNRADDRAGLRRLAPLRAFGQIVLQPLDDSGLVLLAEFEQPLVGLRIAKRLQVALQREAIQLSANRAAFVLGRQRDRLFGGALRLARQQLHPLVAGRKQIQVLAVGRRVVPGDQLGVGRVPAAVGRRPVETPVTQRQLHLDRVLRPVDRQLDAVVGDGRIADRPCLGRLRLLDELHWRVGGRIDLDDARGERPLLADHHQQPAAVGLRPVRRASDRRGVRRRCRGSRGIGGRRIGLARVVAGGAAGEQQKAERQGTHAAHAAERRTLGRSLSHGQSSAPRLNVGANRGKRLAGVCGHVVALGTAGCSRLGGRSAKSTPIAREASGRVELGNRHTQPRLQSTVPLRAASSPGRLSDEVSSGAGGGVA